MSDSKLNFNLDRIHINEFSKMTHENVSRDDLLKDVFDPLYVDKFFPIQLDQEVRLEHFYERQ